MLKKVFKSTPQMVVALFFAAFNSLLEGIVTVKMMGLIDYAIAGDLELLMQKIPPLLIFALTLLPVGILTSITKAWYKKDANLAIKMHYVRGVFKKNISEFQKENTANYISRLTNDCNTIDKNFIDGIYTVFQGIANFFVGIWIISTVNPWMISLSIIIVVVNVIIGVVMRKPLERNIKERSDMFDGYTSYIKEVLSAFHIVKSNNLQEKVTKDYYEKSEEIQKKGYHIEKMMTFINGAQHLTMNASMYGILCILGYLTIQGKITAGGLLIVAQGIQKLAWPLFMLSEALPKVFTSRSLSEKIGDSLKNSDTYEEKIPMSEFEDHIVLQDVEFQYDDEVDSKKILTNVNLNIKKNGKYLIIGPSGGGKSTLLKLLRKYFAPTSGNILIDGKPLRDVKKEDYFSMIANVEQQVFIFHDTLRNNITLYKTYSEEEIQAAIEAAGLTTFIQSLPDGLDTMIYDNGRNISGGERSRVVIARAMLTKASILFMDEAFASLDMERAKEIEQTILKLKDITVINVSHVVFRDTKKQYDGVFTVKGTVKPLLSQE